MPKFTDHQSTKIVKMLMMAQSGTGKSGSFAALANAGYDLYILDFDNGLDILGEYLTEDGKKRTNFVTLTDEYVVKKVGSTRLEGGRRGIPGEVVAPKGTPKAFADGLNLLTRWKDGDDDRGPCSELGEDAVVIIDSATFMGVAALAFTLYVNGHDQANKSDWGEAMDRQEGVLKRLCSAAFNTNVIVTSHVQFSAHEDAVGNTVEGKGYPSFLGQKLPPRVPTYFNNVVTLQNINGSRFIRTNKVSNVDLKVARPSKVADKIPLEGGKGGLAALFEVLKS